MTDHFSRPDGLSDDIVPELALQPVVKREFKPAPWHRPRKQFIRKRQWSWEIGEQILRRASPELESPIRVCGFPSSDYLDLLSMRELCEEWGRKVKYLGFDASAATRAGEESEDRGEAVDLYSSLQKQRMIASSSFVHPGSLLFPDRFELLRHSTSQARRILERFGNFDVVNLDICGCIISPNRDRATEVLEALSELLRWQSTQRMAPWLLFVTTHSSPRSVNREGCRVLIDAIRENAAESGDFRAGFTERAGIDPEVFCRMFTSAGVDLPKADVFIRLFATAFGKWLARKLRLPSPPAFVSMLPSFCFRHVDEANPREHEDKYEPELLSLAYLIEPAPDPGPPGISVEPSPRSDLSERYSAQAIKLLERSFALRDLDALLSSDDLVREEMADETRELLIGCGFEEASVDSYIARHR